MNTYPCRMNDHKRTNRRRLADWTKKTVSELKRTIRNDPHLARDAHRAAWLMVILVAAVVLPMRVVELGWLL